jgi:hypothetical protein
MKSNFPHPMPYVVQAYDSSLERFLDTIHGGHTEPAAKEAEVRLRADPSRWITGKPTKTRVVPAVQVKP